MSDRGRQIAGFARGLVTAGCLSAASLSSGSAVAFPLRVTTASRVEVTLRPVGGAQVELVAVVRDDLGRAVPTGEIELVHVRGATPMLNRCEGDADATPPRGRQRRRLRGGSLCLRGPANDAQLELRFAGDAHHLPSPPASVTLNSAVDRVRFEVDGLEQPLDLGAPSHPVWLTALVDPPRAAEIAVELSLSERGQPRRSLARLSLPAGRRVRWTLSAAALVRPGPAQLELTTERSDRDVRPLLRVARTRWMARAPRDREGQLELAIELTPVGGEVPSGIVELVQGDRSLAVAPLIGTSATLRLPWDQVAGAPATLELTTAEAWWLPARPIQLTLPTRAPSRSRWEPWLAIAGVLVAWILWSWRRAPGHRRKAPHAAAPTGAFELVRAMPGTTAVTGSVVDAHDGTPLRARLTLVGGAFDGVRALGETHANADGTFAIDLGAHLSPATRLRVEAPEHAPLELPAPVPGQLVVRLVTHRRLLLARFVEWARDRARAGGRGEPTPERVRRAAEERVDREVARWATEVEGAAFGPTELTDSAASELLLRAPR